MDDLKPDLANPKPITAFKKGDLVFKMFKREMSDGPMDETNAPELQIIVSNLMDNDTIYFHPAHAPLGEGVAQDSRYFIYYPAIPAGYTDERIERRKRAYEPKTWLGPKVSPLEAIPGKQYYFSPHPLITSGAASGALIRGTFVGIIPKPHVPSKYEKRIVYIDEEGHEHTDYFHMYPGQRPEFYMAEIVPPPPLQTIFERGKTYETKYGPKKAPALRMKNIRLSAMHARGPLMAAWERTVKNEYAKAKTARNSNGNVNKTNGGRRRNRRTTRKN